jgi:hypothetical protein
MDKTQIQKWLAKNAERYLKLFGVPHWHLRVRFGACGNTGSAGQIETQFEYEVADLTIDPNLVEDEEQLEELFIHEISHILPCSFDIVEEMVEALDIDRNAIKSIVKVIHKCHEMTVKSVERMHKQHKNFYQKPSSKK